MLDRLRDTAQFFISAHPKRTAGLVCLVIGLLGPTVPAEAQQHPIEVTSIVNSNADTTLEVNHAGGLLMPGKFADLANYAAPNDSIPAEGAGTRLMWYPEKAAFRAGLVGDNSSKSDVWDAVNVGTHSVAFGQDTRASARDATAMGDGTTASDGDATAMGDGTTASGPDATAMGRNTEAIKQSATAMGNETTANGAEATATGFNTTASADFATSMNYQTTASGPSATAMGVNTTAAENWSLTIGKFNSANTSKNDHVFVVGNGSGSSSRSDALVLDKSGNLTTAGTVNGSSDRRLKTGIEPIDDGILEALSEIRPVRFEFKNQRSYPSGEQIGLIAQDVRKEFPAIVSRGSDGYLSLAYSRVPALLLKGLQEQQAKIKDQEKTIASLQKRVQEIETLKKRVAQLEGPSNGSVLAGLFGSLPAGLALVLVALGGGLAAGLIWRGS